MSNLIPFHFESSLVRVVMIAGNPWWVAADVCKVLEIQNATDMLKRLDDDERQLVDFTTLDSNYTITGNRMVNLINEQGFIKTIIFSRKRQALQAKNAILDQIKDIKSVINALNEFEIPDDLPDMYIYAIRESETGRIKLGISKNPNERLRQLQTSNSQKLELIAYKKAVNRFSDEKEMQIKNNKYHIRGEWFKPEVDISSIYDVACA